MKLSDFVKKVTQQFFLIFALIIMIMTVLRQAYAPDLSFDLKSIYIIMLFSVLGALSGFILYSPHTISEKKMRLRVAIHFITLETMLNALAAIMGIADSASSLLTLALEIAVIYAVIRLLSWRNDKKTADQINEKLKSLKN